jgi:capsular polysaccharide biosynthesis protein
MPKANQEAMTPPAATVNIDVISVLKHANHDLAAPLENPFAKTKKNTPASLQANVFTQGETPQRSNVSPPNRTGPSVGFNMGLAGATRL